MPVAAFNLDRNGPVSIAAGFPYQDLIKEALERATGVEGIESIRAGLASPSDVARSCQALVIAAAYARRGYKVHSMHSSVLEGCQVHDLRVTSGGVHVPVAVAGLKSGTEPGLGLVQEKVPDDYRDIKGVVQSVASGFPEGCGGVVHLFLQAERASELFESVERGSQYLQSKLIGHLPGLSILVIESLQSCPWTGRTLHRRYLLPNHRASFALPQTLNLGLANTELPRWRPLDAVFSIEYDCMLPEYPEQVRGGLAELEWLSSPHGCVQLRQFMLPGGDCRIDLLTPGYGKVMATMKCDGLCMSTAHNIRLDLHTGLRQLDIWVNGWKLAEGDYSVRFYP